MSPASSVTAFELVFPTGGGPALARIRGRGLEGAALQVAGSAARALPGSDELVVFAVDRSQPAGPFVLTTGDGITRELKAPEAKMMASPGAIGP